jgi:hypothetical protein
MNSPAGGGAHNTGSGGHVIFLVVVQRGDPVLFKEIK